MKFSGKLYHMIISKVTKTGLYTHCRKYSFEKKHRVGVRFTSTTLLRVKIKTEAASNITKKFFEIQTFDWYIMKLKQLLLWTKNLGHFTQGLQR